MQVLLQETPNTAQGIVLVKSPIQTFVDENTLHVRLELKVDYSAKTEKWTAEEIRNTSWPRGTGEG